MPFTEFLTNGDLKFVIILYAFLIASIILFIKKKREPKLEVKYNNILKGLVNWSLLISLFSLLLGLLHSFYFISKAKGVASHLLFGGLANTLITPVLGVAIAIIINVLSKTCKEKTYDTEN